MKPYSPSAVLALTTSLATLASAAEFDWPQWQGPDRNGISREAGLLKEWPEDWSGARVEGGVHRDRLQRSGHR